MTALALVQSSWARTTSLWRRIILAAIVVAAIGVAAALALLAKADASKAAQLPPEKVAILLKAASGDAVQDFRAVGEEAKVINAALPFNGGPILRADPFRMTGAELDQRRAELCLTQAVYYEAGFEPMEGRRAVAQVVLNRTRHPAYPKSVCGVVYQRSTNNICQFTFVCDGALYRAPSRARWIEAQQVARAALAGHVDSAVGSATHYHADYVAPRWAPMLAKVAKLGQHIFYRWPGAWGQPAAFSGRYIGEPRDPMSLRPSLAEIQAGDTPLAADPAMAGPPIARAPNDVGGLLDTSKGWTLNIPGPDEISSADKLIAAQEGRSVQPQAKPVVAVTAMSAAPAR